LLKLDYERQQTRDREAHESGQALRVEIQRKQHAEDVEIKHQLAKIMPDFEAFRDQIESASRAEFEQYAAVQREKLEEAKDARRQEVRANRMREAAAREAKRVQDIADAARAEGILFPVLSNLWR
jgi:translation initiation factor 3 subunit A